MHCESECCQNSDGRRFMTKEEKMDKLKEYKEWLDNESKGVSEAISELKKAK